MARICPACGRANDDDASFCQGCGSAFAAGPSPDAFGPAAEAFGQGADGAAPAPAPPAPPPARRGGARGWIAALVVAIAIAVIAVAALLVVPHDDASEAAGPETSAAAPVAVSPSPALDHYLAGAAGPKADRLGAILADGTIEPIARFSGKRISQIAYSPDGAYLACIVGTLKHSELWLFDAADGGGRQVTATTPDVVAVDSVAWLSPTELLLAGFQKIATTPGQNAELLVYDTATRGFTPLLDRRDATLRGVSVSASRDGGKVAFVTYADAKTDESGAGGAKERLQLLDTATGAVTVLGENQAESDVEARAFVEPLISPSGAAVIFRRSGSDAGTSYTVVGADGTTLMPAKEALFPAGYAWDPDGTRVVFTGHPVEPAAGDSGAGPAIFWVFDLGAGTTKEIARAKDAMVEDLSWSPKGGLIAWAEYTGDEYRTGTVYVMPAGGGESLALAEGALSPVWAPGAAPPLQTSPSP